jgi:2-polyprenyl-6-methoxyphenol hydroxylase-like FAD-dependent oxidoreductase
VRWVGLDRAVVLGAGIAGLTAARVLAGHGVAVTLVERDRLAEGVGHRPGVPQSRHVHALLTRGSRELERLFPGLTSELLAAGALELDWTEQRIRSLMGWSPRYTSGLRSVFCSRELLEGAVRRRVLALPQVKALDIRDAVGLVGDSRRVTGVRVRVRGVPSQAGTSTLEADLVVDATGRASSTPRWLEALGLEAPRESVVSSQLGYASQEFSMPAGFAEDWRLLVVRQPAPSTRAAALYPIEGNRWFLTLAGHGGELSSHDQQGFLEFARSIDGIAEVIDASQPVGPVHGYRRTENRWRHWEGGGDWPEGLVVLGDAMCSFNPAYGQGMTVATLQAVRLDDVLTERPWGPTSARAVQRRAAGVLRGAWTLATQEDFREPSALGHRSPATRVAHRYTDLVLRAATRDVAVNTRFFEVAHLVRPAAALAEPSMVRRVLHAA